MEYTWQSSSPHGLIAGSGDDCTAVRARGQAAHPTGMPLESDLPQEDEHQHSSHALLPISFPRRNVAVDHAGPATADRLNSDDHRNVNDISAFDKARRKILPLAS